MKLLSVLLASAACAALPARAADAGAAPTSPAQISSNIVRGEAAGVDLLSYRTGVRDVITLRGSLPAGDAFAPASNPALAKLTAMMLDKGTRLRDKFAIAARLESVGAELSFGAGEKEIEFSAKCLARDLPLLIELMAEQLRQPSFSEEELDKLRKQVSASVRRRQESPDARASDAFFRAIYPEGHPNWRPTSDAFVAAVEGTTAAQVSQFHASHYGPRGMRLVAVGDVDAEQLKREVSRAFEGWSGGGAAAKSVGANPTVHSEQSIAMEDKPSVTIILGQATLLHHSDPDALPLRVGTAILGSGFTGRLMSTVRDKEGLTYGINAGVSGDTFVDGHWSISATFSPAVLEQGIASTRRELLLWHREGVSDEELQSRKTNLIGTYKVGLSTTGGLANQILITLQRGYPLSWLDEYPARVGALTREQVNTALRRHLDPERMVLVKAGTLRVPEPKK